LTRVAIIAAFHDDGTTVSDTVASLRREPDTELVVVDDGSTDPASLEALAGLAALGVNVLRQENSGPSAAWMAGLSVTSAPYVMPFSSDDLLVPGATLALAGALDANPEAAAAWGDFESFGAASAYVPSAPALCPWYVTYVNSLPGIALFRRDALHEVGGWQLRSGIEDWDLWMRLAVSGFGGVHVPKSTFRYRRDAAGRFRGRVHDFEPFYEELRLRNRGLFAARAANRQRAAAPRALRLLFPVVDRLPFVSRLVKVQVCDALSLVFWRAGLRVTARILVQGLIFRAHVLRGRRDETVRADTSSS
jgi:glycosyltransferase involved in cell wall biosynthesis